MVVEGTGPFCIAFFNTQDTGFHPMRTVNHFYLAVDRQIPVIIREVIPSLRSFSGRNDLVF